MNTQEIIARDMKEEDLQANIIEMAMALGYHVLHIRDSRRQRVEGLPDLLCGGHNRLIYIECKREQEKYKLSPWQELWRDLILGAGHEWYLWRPSQWLDGTVIGILTPKGVAK